MSRLPRQDVPVGLQRYQPGHFPKRRERTVVGRSNRLEHLEQMHNTMERVLVPLTDGNGERRTRSELTVGQRFALSGYRSGQGLRTDTEATRSLVHTLRAAETGGPDGHPATSIGAATTTMSGRTKRGFQPPPSPPRSPPRAHLATEKARLEAEMNPAVAAMLCVNRHGVGHTTTPENFFLRRGGQDADYYTTQPSRTGANRAGQQAAAASSLPFTRNRHVPAVAEGGGTLEYADPVQDEYAYQAVVARFDNRQLRAAQAAASSSANEVTPSATQSTRSVAGTTATMRRVSDPVSTASPRHGTTSPLPPQDSWLSTYVPSARPYDVEPFRGRCGYSDLRLTYHRVQATPASDMYAATRDFQSTYTQPLETPNAWQLHDRRAQRRKV